MLLLAYDWIEPIQRNKLIVGHWQKLQRGSQRTARIQFGHQRLRFRIHHRQDCHGQGFNRYCIQDFKKNIDCVVVGCVFFFNFYFFMLLIDSGDEEAGQWSCILQDGRTSTAQWHILRLKHECDQVNDLFKHSHSFIINLPSLIHDSHQAYYPSWVSGNDQTIVISIIINSNMN